VYQKLANTSLPQLHVIRHCEISSDVNSLAYT